MRFFHYLMIKKNGTLFGKIKRIFFINQTSIPLTDICEVKYNNLDDNSLAQTSFLWMKTIKGRIFSIPFENDNDNDNLFIARTVCIFQKEEKGVVRIPQDSRLNDHISHLPIFNLKGYGKRGMPDNYLSWFIQYIVGINLLFVSGYFLISLIVTILLITCSLTWIILFILGVTITATITFIYTIFLVYYFRAIPINQNKVSFVSDISQIYEIANNKHIIK